MLIVDAQDSTREVFAEYFAHSTGFRVVGRASTAKEALWLVNRHAPRVALVDIDFGKRSCISDGIELVRRLAEKTSVVVLSAADADRNIYEAYVAGAVNFCSRDVPMQEILQAVRQASAGTSPMRPLMIAVFQPLTKREREIVELIATGATNKSIANKLALSERTVTTHVINLMKKLHVSNRAGAVTEAMQRGEIKKAG